MTGSRSATGPLPDIGPRRDTAPPRLRAVKRRRQTIFRWVVVSAVGLFFLIPMVAMLDFSTRALSGKRIYKAWQALVDPATLATKYAPLWDGLKNSLVLMVLTVVLMVVILVPTMTWVRLRVPWLRRTMEFLSLLPLTIPAIVLVVGLAPIYRVLSNILSTSAIWLCFAYVILVLPFAYRALDAGLAAIDVKVLSEAARSLGAGWGTVMWRVVMPNIRTAVVSACFLTVALVLGEFTVASLLNRQNLQTGILLISAADARLAAAVALVALVLAFLLLLVLSMFSTGRSRSRRRAVEA